jgi:hypothetical protein
VHIALHHGTAFIVLDVAFPSLCGHAVVFAEALLAEVPEGQVVGVGHQVLDFAALHLL